MLKHNPTTGKLTAKERADIELQLVPLNAKMSVATFTIEEWRKLHTERYALDQLLLGK